MKSIITTSQDYLLPLLVAGSFITYYFDLLHDGMVTSGIIAVILMIYIGIIWREQVHDERDEYIRSKVDRILYIMTLVLLLIDITYKTFAHVSYMNELSILTILSITKVALSKLMHANS